MPFKTSINANLAKGFNKAHLSRATLLCEHLLQFRVRNPIDNKCKLRIWSPASTICKANPGPEDPCASRYSGKRQEVPAKFLRSAVLLSKNFCYISQIQVFNLRKHTGIRPNFYSVATVNFGWSKKLFPAQPDRLPRQTVKDNYMNFLLWNELFFLLNNLFSLS